MSFYIDLILDADNLSCSVAYPLDLAGYEVAVKYLAIPKTFENTTEIVQLRSSMVTAYPFFDSKDNLLTAAVHDTHYSKHFIHEPVSPQYRPVSCGRLYDMRFTIVDEKEKALEIPEGKVIITLHFRQGKC